MNTEIYNAGQGFFRNTDGMVVGLFDKGMWENYLLLGGHWFYVMGDVSFWDEEDIRPNMDDAEDCDLADKIEELAETGFEYIGYKHK